MTHRYTRRTLLRSTSIALGTISTTGLTTASEDTAADADDTPSARTDLQSDVPFVVQTSPNFQFNPQVLVVPTGATVTWFGDVSFHSVTSAATMSDALDGEHNDEDETAFDYPLPTLGDAEHTFDSVGEYPYFCRPHVGLGMVGKIHVV